jgi:hypothetical protein
VADRERKTKALEKLNELVAAFFLLGAGLDVVREHDLVEAHVNPETKTLAISSWNPERLKRPIDIQTAWGLVRRPEFLFGPDRIDVPESTLGRALALATEISSDAMKKSLSGMALEAWTLLRNGEYSQSLHSSWQVLENHVGSLWDKYIGSEDTTKTRRVKLRDPSRWSVDRRLEILNLAGRIDKNEYGGLMAWKEKRNRFVHYGVRVTEDEANQCLEWATKVARDVCCVPNSGA